MLLDASLHWKRYGHPDGEFYVAVSRWSEHLSVVIRDTSSPLQHPSNSM
jgi:hypothetical protein